jgi:proline iminopeptidase
MTSNIDIPSALGLPPLPSNSPDTIAALMWAREVVQEHFNRSFAVTDPKGIEELRSVKIGGVDQWLHIRGRNRDNPVLLYLHGGPGAAIIGAGCGGAGQRSWEDYFTVVLWDQRQTGKSYYPADDENTPLSVNQFIEDTEELIEYLRDYLSKDKLVLMGASWGTVLGPHLAKRHPEWLHAYIGVGQIVNWTEGERTLYERLLGHAQAHNEKDLIAKMESIIPLMHPDNSELEKTYAENAYFVRREISRLAGESGMHHLFFDEMLKLLNFDRLISPLLTFTDHINTLFGGPEALYRPPYIFTKEFMKINLPKDIGSTFDVPIFFFSGIHDYQTPTTLSDQWFEKIEAPHKELIHFKESSHFILNEEPGKVLVSLVSKVLPFAQGGGD